MDGGEQCVLRDVLHARPVLLRRILARGILRPRRVVPVKDGDGGAQSAPPRIPLFSPSATLTPPTSLHMMPAVPDPAQEDGETRVDALVRQFRRSASEEDQRSVAVVHLSPSPCVGCSLPRIALMSHMQRKQAGSASRATRAPQTSGDLRRASLPSIGRDARSMCTLRCVQPISPSALCN